MTTEAEALEVAALPDSMWQMKPWWCQPWSIVLTGVAIPLGSWLLLHRLLVTLPISLVIVGWWALFLWMVPTQYAAAVRDAKLAQQTPPER